MHDNGTILIIAPTRELAVQLMRDTTSIVSNLMDDNVDTITTMHPSILLAVRGVNIPTKEDMQRATVLIGTPFELIQVLTKIQGGQDFLAGDVLSTIVLDEVDVLLPNNNVPKALRTSLDNPSSKQGKRHTSMTPQEERRILEQKRKMKAAQRKGMNVIKNNQGESATVLTDTDKLLRIVASRRFVGGDTSTPYQILAGSATASRKTLERLNRSLRDAASEVSSSIKIVWSGDVKACRPPPSSLSSISTTAIIKNEDTNNDVDIKDITNDDTSFEEEQQQHTIRTVTVPSQVTHQYVAMDKESANSSNMVLAKLAKVVKLYQPKKALIFICGEFKKTIQNEKSMDPNKNIRGSTNASRRNTMYRRKKMAKLKEKENKNAGTIISPLSARKACSILSQYDINAQPLHVALGLEGKEEDYKDEDDESTFYVTFEGSARGLHFDNVDIVFIVGRPSSAASYLHLAGRVGRSGVSSNDNNDTGNNGTIVIRPGKVISFCTKGSSSELMKWTKQVGGSELQQIDC